jgi:hypothetical protein
LVVTKVKSVEVAAKGKMLPKAVVSAVQARVPYEFNVSNHTRLWKHFKLHPLRWSAPDGGITDSKYCLPNEPTGQYVFTSAWVDKVIREVGTPDKYEAFFGYPPKKGKVTPITAVRETRPPLHPASGEQEVS